MRMLGGSGVWEIFIPGAGEGTLYKFEVKTPSGALTLKTDPYGFFFETPPKNSSIVWDNRKFRWDDESWMEKRRGADPLRSPLSIYEVHAGSWMKKNKFESLSYRELAEPLTAYVQNMGFTHVEFMPVSEHAFYPSWGYQVTGFYAPTSRFGTPDDFQFLINQLHQAGIGVLLDWVPAHFPRDDWGLARFDGTALYEHEDPRQGAHQDWGTLIFNYGRHEVRNFLAANALFWLDRFHIDGLRVDAVASMLYLDYSRKEGEWLPNKFGGRENLEAVEFIKHFNYVVHTEHPGVITVAEESTAWPLVTRPPYLGGLGFSFKWNMGWMHDTLGYFSRDSIYRKYHQNDLTFAMLYHHNENFVLPLSHDEVVHGKRTLLEKMPGDNWQKFANLRLLFGYMYAHPGKKLLFMGGELAQRDEFWEEGSVDWSLENSPPHRWVQRLVKDLNHLHTSEPALFQVDFEWSGFEWIDANDATGSILSFIRRAKNPDDFVVVICNFTPVVRGDYRVGVPTAGYYREILNSDSAYYEGSAAGNSGGVRAEPIPWHGRPWSIKMKVPPLAAVYFKPQHD